MSGLFEDLEQNAKTEQLSSFFYTLAAASGIASPSFPFDKISPKQLIENTHSAYASNPDGFSKVSDLLDLSLHYNSLFAEKKQSRLLKTILKDLEVDSARFFEDYDYRDSIAYGLLETLDNTRVDKIMLTLQELGLDRISLVCSHLSWLFCLDSLQVDRIDRFRKEIITSFETSVPILIPLHSKVSLTFFNV
jgi:hypothetical protein